MTPSSQASPQGDVPLVMGDFNAKVGTRQPFAMSSAVGLCCLGETNEAGEQLEDFCLKHELALAEAAAYLDLSWWRHPESDGLHFNCTKMENKLDELSHVSRSRLRRCDTDHQLLVATLKVRLAKRQHSIPRLNLQELKKEKAVHFAAEMTDRFMTLEATQNEVIPEDLWKGTKTVLLEVARGKIGCVKLQKKKKWLSDETFEAIKEKREAKGKSKN